jgi:RNA polymerase sigma factor (sigma-70 family)
MLKDNSRRNEALEYIYNENKNSISNLILNNNGSINQAKDIFQDCLIVFYENVINNKYLKQSKISTYIFSIAKFKWLNELKRIQTKEKHIQNINIENKNNTTTESAYDSFISTEHENQVMAIFNLLGKKCRSLLLQSIYYNLSMKEIKENDNYNSEQLVRNKKYKCLNKLKALTESNPHIIKILRSYE